MTDPQPELRPRQLAPDGSLAADFVQGLGKAGTLLPSLDPGHPPEPSGPGSPGGPAVGEALRTTTPAAREKLDRILEGEGVLVSTGQQPILFLGPLYVLYKAVTAVETARWIERTAGIPALAVFWIGSDDHDWREVGRTHLLDTDHQLRSLRVEAPASRARRSMGETPVPEALRTLLDEATQYLPDTDFIDEYLELFRDSYLADRTLGEAFGHALQGVLGTREMAWLDSSHEAVRRAAAPLFRRALTEQPAVEEALRQGERRVRDAGYRQQLHLEEGGVPLFLDREEGRTRLFLDGDVVRMGRDGPTRPLPEMLRELEERPGRFTPNVSLRPVLESYLLPVSATVVGPGELAYWSELGVLFEWAEVNMPSVRPRLSWWVLEEKIRKVLRKVEADPPAFSDGGEELVRRATARGRPREVERALERARQEVGETFGRLESTVAEVLPGIRSAVGAARHEAFEAIEALADAVDQRVAERQAILHRQIRKAARHLYPDSRPQERVLNPLYYLCRYGPAFVERLQEATRQQIESRGTRRG